MKFRLHSEALDNKQFNRLKIIIDGGRVNGTFPRLKVKLCLFVLDRPTHNLPPQFKKLYCVFAGGKIFLSFAAKTSDSMPGVRF